jgi:hypothetical protein
VTANDPSYGGAQTCVVLLLYPRAKVKCEALLYISCDCSNKVHQVYKTFLPVDLFPFVSSFTVIAANTCIYAHFPQPKHCLLLHHLIIYKSFFCSSLHHSYVQLFWFHKLICLKGNKRCTPVECTYLPHTFFAGLHVIGIYVLLLQV